MVARDLRISLQTLRRAVRARFWQLVTLEALHKALTAGLVLPFSAFVLAMLIRTTGSTAVSNNQIMRFALSPAGVAAGVVSGVTAFVVLFAEQAGLLLILSGYLRGRRVRAWRAVWIAWRNIRELLLLGLILLLAAAAAALPFLMIAVGIYFRWLREHDINYYLAQRPPEVLAAVVIGVVLAALLALVWAVIYLRWMYALPECILAGARATEALRRSVQLSRVNWRRSALVLGAWWLAVTLVGNAGGLVLLYIAKQLVAWTSHSPALLAPVLGAIVVVQLLASALLALVASTSHALLVLGLYVAAERAAGRHGQETRLVKNVPHHERGSRGWVVAAATLVFVVVSVVTSARLLAALPPSRPVAITAHRGSSLRAPENTLAAIRLAIAERADVAEIDVQLTADDVVVVLHDSDLMRIAGSPKKVWDTPYAELRELDAGSWFDPQFAGQRVPTLREVIELARDRIRLNIELKFGGAKDGQLVEHVVAILQAEDFHNECVISSLNLDGVLAAKRADPRLRCGLIAGASLGRLTELPVDFLSVSMRHVNADLVRAAHARRMQVHVWTVNSAADLFRMLALGVDNLLTDDPPLARQIRGEYEQLSDPERLLVAKFDEFRLLLEASH